MVVGRKVDLMVKKMVKLVGPSETDRPVCRRRGKGKKKLEWTQGTINEFFSKVKIPKEWLDDQKLVANGKGGMRKRKVEAGEETEQQLEHPEPKTGRFTKSGNSHPVDMTVPGGMFLPRGGAKSSFGS